MPKSREEIRHDQISGEVWRNNHTQVGGLWFDPRAIRPLGSHILVELDSEPSVVFGLEIPDMARGREIGSRLGTILAVGPGKWHEKPGLSWELTKQYFIPTTLQPGDRVLIGHYSDWESWHCDYEGRGANIVLCQEADVRLYEPRVSVD